MAQSGEYKQWFYEQTVMKSIPKQSVAPHLKMMCYIFDWMKQIRHEAYSNKDMMLTLQ